MLGFKKLNESSFISVYIKNINKVREIYESQIFNFGQKRGVAGEVFL